MVKSRKWSDMDTKRMSIVLILCLLIALTVAGQGCAETYQLTAIFNGTGSKLDPEMMFTVSMDDSWFNKPSSCYDHNLARLSLGMAGAAFRSTSTEDMNDKDRNIRAFFKAAEFTNYEQLQFDIMPTIDTIGTAMAMKQMSDGEENYTLIAIAISGAGYGNEWLSNFSIENDDVHAGFAHAASLVEARFEDYRSRLAPEGRIKVWISGYSRASATANLTAHDLITADNGIAPDDIFAYCFAVPMCTRTPSADPQIYNICGSFDPVPMVPLAEWGYSRYGITRFITAAELDTAYASKASAAAQIYTNASGREDFASSQEANWLLHKVLEVLYALIPDAGSYSAQYQQAIKDAWIYQGSAIKKLNLLISEISEATEADGNKNTVSLSELTTLLKQCMYDSMMETYGVAETKLTSVMTSGIGLAHEHFPGVYMAWLLSGDENTLFGHATSGFRLAITDVLQETEITGENLTTSETLTVSAGTGGGEDVNGQLNLICIGSESMIALPAGSDYHITFPSGGYRSQLALTSYQCGKVSTLTAVTPVIKAAEGDAISVYVMANGTGYAQYNGSDYPFEVADTNGSVMMELRLEGNYSEEYTDTVTDTALYLFIPHLAVVLILVIGLLVRCIIRLCRGKHAINTRVENENPVIRILFYIAAVSCLFEVQLKFRYAAAALTVFNGDSNMIQRMLGTLSKFSSLSIELADTILYLVLFFMCLRAPYHELSLKHCRLLAILMLIPEAFEILRFHSIGFVYWLDIIPTVILVQIVTLTAIASFLRRKRAATVR